MAKPHSPSSGIPAITKPHVPGLDGIRGTAILSVLCYHLLMANTVTGSGFFDFLSSLRAACWIGVDLFFCLSGFLITGILHDSLSDKHYFRNFYIRRALRIFPLYYGYLLALSLFLYSTSYAEKRYLFLLLAFLQNTPLWWNHPLPSIWPHLTGHLWSLAVEEQFYVVWPVVVFLIRDRRKLIVTAFCLVGAVLAFRIGLLKSGAPFEDTYMLTFARADSLLLGSALALGLRGPSRGRIVSWAKPAFSVAFLICLGDFLWAGNFSWTENVWINTFGYTVIAIAGTSLIAMVTSNGSIPERIFNRPTLKFFGKYSYGIYVFHPMVGLLIHRYWMDAIRSHVHQKALDRVVFMLIAVLCTIVLAVISFKTYEAPFLRLKKYAAYRQQSNTKKV
jgi:peptidoglycan/LPS O-acetylase OafA/YrhL